MVGVPFFSPTQWISIFDWGGLGLQEFSPPQGFLLGGRRVVASKGIGTLGSEILMIVLEVRVDSARNSEYVSILARTNDTTLITDYEALVLAITETIRNASEPEPTPTPMPNGQADVNADSLPSAGSSISLSVNGYLRSDDLCVEVGDTVRLVAQGTIKLGFWLGSSDPNGIEQGMLGAIGDSYDIVPHHPHGALLCKISGESEWRICGSYLEFTSERAGCLEFEINDTDQSDNTGQFNITASLLPPVSLTPTPQPVATSDQSDASSTLLSAEEFLAETEEGDIEAVLAQADLYYWANEYAEALTLYQYALELDPDSVVALTGRGNIYRINKDYEQALRDFEDALAIDPTYPPIYRGLGKLSSDQGDLQQALLEFNKAIELDANYTKAYIARGDLYSNLSDYTSALADYNKAISLDPSDEALYLTRGYTHYYLNNFDAALADFSTTIRLKPDSPAPYAGRGDAYLAKDNNDAALTEYTQAIELDSTYAYAFDRRGLAYAAKGNWNQAIADYTQAIELGLEYSELYRRRGDAFRELNEGSKAFADFDHAIQQDPENMNARYNRAWLHDESGHTEEAYDDYSRYLELDTGDNDFAKYACLRVNQLYPSIAKSFLDAALSRPCQRFLSSSNLPTCYVKETYYDSDDVTYACYDSNNLWAFDKTCNGTGPWSSCDCPAEFKEWGAC
jgi:tetratricopeptide (TPR) repeat protein